MIQNQWAFVGALVAPPGGEAEAGESSSSIRIVTAFLVSRQQAIAAWHVLESWDQPLAVRFDWGEVRCKIAISDDAQGAVVLDLADEAPEGVWIPRWSAADVSGAKWDVAWHSPNDAQLRQLAGEVLGRSMLEDEIMNTPAWNLGSAGSPQELIGIEGAPVVVEEEVRGFVHGLVGEELVAVAAEALSTVEGVGSMMAPSFVQEEPEQLEQEQRHQGVQLADLLEAVSTPTFVLEGFDGWRFGDGVKDALGLAGGRQGDPEGPVLAQDVVVGIIELVQRDGPRGAFGLLHAAIQELDLDDPLSALGETGLMSLQRESLSKDALTEGASKLLEEAWDHARRTARGGRRPLLLSAHLLAALLTVEQEDAATPRGHLARTGVSLEKLRAGLTVFVRDGRYGSFEAWKSILYGHVMGGTRVAGYHADDSGGPDLLDIRRDVDALAHLVTAKRIDPPLSIGLFGDWGSGKTYFMRSLQARVRELSGEARRSEKAQGEISFYKKVAQIEFNAWHYVESDLWASLMTHVFENLKVTEKDGTSELGKRREALLAEIAKKADDELEATAEIEKLEDEIQTKSDRVDELTDDIGQEESTIRPSLDRLRELTVDDLVELVDLTDQQETDARELVGEIDDTLLAAGAKANDLKSSVERARAVVESGASLLAPYLRGKDRGARLLKLVLVLALTLAVGAGLAGAARTLNLHEVVKEILATIGQWSLLIGAFATWLTKASSSGERWLRRAEKWQAMLTIEADELRSERARLEEEVAAHHDRVVRLERDREAARLQKKRLEERLERTTHSVFLADFIAGKATSDDYRKRLGVTARIRRDLQTLSEAIGRHNTAIEDPEEEVKAEQHAPHAINRIVLYIDDLDRCEPEQVVKVLQAVHLLLAFRLFVVVVGVDARWVSSSLKSHYKELLDSGETSPKDELGAIRPATPTDYLEKIFQVPFWIRPMNDDGRVEMIAGLTGGPSTTAPAKPPAKPSPEPPPPSQPAAAPAPASATPPAPSTPTAPAPAPSAPTAPSGQVTPKSTAPTPSSTATAKTPVIDLTPQGLDIGDAERDFMVVLSPLLGRSPRALKRFINVYRLIKSRLDPAEVAVFLAERGTTTQFQCVMLLLAVVTGMPALSRRFFSVLRQLEKDRVERDDHEHRPTLVTALGGLDVRGPAARDLATLRSWVREAERSSQSPEEDGPWGEVEVAVLAAEAGRVARFSFHVEQT
ncbi:MAG: P-loop NTPase fold protein [Acidobacteriota bacterium]